MNIQQTSGFPSGYCPPDSGIDNCPPDHGNNIKQMKAFFYTVLIFLGLCLVSYIASA